ncbi:MAG: thiosulfate sulfurtransferase [Candidatus Eisenbacteria bacterium]|nr:thiosulfate sulfurtransferase [Candidatus Eisenbacteria bacterium]
MLGRCYVPLLNRATSVSQSERRSPMPSPLSSSELRDAVLDKNTALVDLRQIDAWNGWAMDGERRGGHIPGSAPFPLRWFDELDERETLAVLARGGATPEMPVVVYGSGSEDADEGAARLEQLGFSQVRFFQGGFSVWAGQRSGPIEWLPRFEKLVPASWVADLVEGGELSHHDGRPHVLIHVSFDNREDYDEGHIPGSIYLDTLLLERPEDWNRRTAEELAEAVRSLGITHDTTAVLYGRTGRPTMKMEQPGRAAGQIGAMRAAWLLRYIGVEDVRMLNGGLASWRRAGGELSTEESPPAPVPAFGRKVPSRPALIVRTTQAKELLADPMGDLVSMRSWEEFIGEVSGYHYVHPKGRIPGAVFGNCGADAYHMENYRNHDQTMRPYSEIRERWAAAELTPDKRIAFYCGTGWRASEAAFAAYVMGWKRVAVYDDGWYGWSSDESNPIATGVPDGHEGSGRPEGLLRADVVSEGNRGQVVAGPRSDRPPDDCAG